jgi:hypothetical protein
MRHQWLAYLVVAVLAIGAGVVIAGLPETDPDDAVVITATSEPVETTTPADTTTTDSPTTTESPAATTAPTTEVPASDPPTTDASTTVAPTTTEPAPSIPDRADIVVVVANGSGVTGAAARNAERLAELGYENVRLRNGTQIFEFTTVFYVPGFEAAAARLAEDLDLLPDFVAPLDQAPVVVELPPDVELLAYIGLDRP